MKKNEKGFSAVEILVVVVIVGLIGAVGWLVYDRQNGKTATNSTQTDTADTTKETETPEVTTKEYKGKLISFQYPKEWTPATETKTNVDEFVSLKTADYKTGEASIGGEEVKAGAIVSVSVMKTSATTIQAVEAPYIRGTVLQSKIQDGEVQLKEITTGGVKAYEFTWQYEGDGSRVVEFISNGLFVHAVLDTTGDETAQTQYQPFLNMLKTLKVN